MRIAWILLVCGMVFQACLSTGAAEKGKLLPTASLAKQLNSLGTPLSESPTGTTMESRRKSGLVLRDRISQFIIDQIEATPNITKDQMLAQLRAILCSNPNVECDCNHPPYIFANGWFGPKETVQFVVAYQLSLGFIGPTGSITVIQSYTVTDGKKVQRSAQGGSEFDAYIANFQMVKQFYEPAETWVLAWGMVQGASGRGLHSQAALYRVGVDGVKTAWNDEKEDNLTAQSNDIGWEVSYASHDLLYGYDPKPYFFDVYELNYRDRTFSRIVHYQHAAD
jgi:hypothetical protein